MPRSSLSTGEKACWIEGWKPFGRWLRERRIAKRLTLQQAAEAVGVSRRQWIRYEQGARVQYKRLDSIADALDISIGRLRYLAGYKAFPKRHDAKKRLRRIHDMLVAGEFDCALEQFLLVYQSIKPDDESDLYIDGLTPPNFANAVISLDGLPRWLFARIITWGQKRVEREKTEPGTKVRFRNLVVNECLVELRRNTPPIIDSFPQINVLGSARPERLTQNTP
jgi:transcriptional regulator with XRE-family HTH domain